MSAQAAAELLGVKPATLYAYVSRGWIESVPMPSGRPHGYRQEDLLRLKARHDARRGHGPVAAGALRWGEAVLETQISHVGPRGPEYRGQAAVDLAQTHDYEAVTALLWGAAPLPFPRPDAALLELAGPLLARVERPIERFSMAVPVLAALDPDRPGAGPALEHGRARRLIRSLAASLAIGHGARRWTAASAAPSVAASVLSAFGHRPQAPALRLANQALVLSADHELNPSTFAARVAASTGADLYAVLAAALATLSGPQHGGACDRVEALIDEVGRPEQAASVLRRRAERGDSIPGFIHPLYPDGDPRAPPLWEGASALAPQHPRIRVQRAIAKAMRKSGRGEPTIDFALVAVAAALQLPQGATAIFALGRMAGWVAHALEQRAQGFILRPRARYVGA